MAESIRKTTFAHNVMTKYLEAREISRRLEHLAREVGWLVCIFHCKYSDQSLMEMGFTDKPLCIC